MSDLAFVIYSVPVFGDGDGKSYIALLSDRSDAPDTFMPHWEWDGKQQELEKSDRPWSHMEEHPIFCKGEGNHGERREVQIKGRTLLCPWPSKDQQKISIKVVLQDKAGKTLGTVWTKHTPGLLKRYNTMACVRDVFDEPNPNYKWQGKFSGAFKQLVEWVEFHTMLGVDHFLFYTFKGTEDAVLEVMHPYIKKGLATRVHFDYHPWEQMVRQGFLTNDCLLRAKNHAKWLMPTIDIDEYISPNLAKLSDLMPRRFFSGLWDSILDKKQMKHQQVREISFQRQRFARSSADELDISSFWTEGHPGTHSQKFPKYVVNPDLAYHVSTHIVESFDEDTNRLEVPASMGIVHHYRFSKRAQKGEYEDQVGNKDPKTNEKDTSFKEFVPMLEDALQKRFRLKSQDQLKNFLRQMSEKRPAESDSLKKLDPFALKTAEGWIED